MRKCLWERHESICFPLSYGKIVGQTLFFYRDKETSLGEESTAFKPVFPLKNCPFVTFYRSVNTYDFYLEKNSDFASKSKILEFHSFFKSILLGTIYLQSIEILSPKIKINEHLLLQIELDKYLRAGLFLEIVNF